MAGQIKAAAPAGTEFGTFALPATDNPADTRMPGAAGGAYAVNAKSGKKDLAEKFIDFLAEPENMSVCATKGNAGLALPNDAFKADPSFETLLSFQRQNKTAPFMDQLCPNPKVQQEHLTGVQELFSGTTSPGKLLGQMDDTHRNG